MFKQTGGVQRCSKKGCAVKIGAVSGCRRKTFGSAAAECCAHFFEQFVSLRGCDYCRQALVLSKTPTSVSPAAATGFQAGKQHIKHVSALAWQQRIATCDVPGCGRPTFDGQAGQCCRTCKLKGGTAHGPECNKRNQPSSASPKTPTSVSAAAALGSQHKKHVSALAWQQRIATCEVPGCGRPTFDGQAGQCCRTCKRTNGSAHGPMCRKRSKEGLAPPASASKSGSWPLGAAASQDHSEGKLRARLGITSRKFWVSDGVQRQKLYDLVRGSEEYAQIARRFEETAPAGAIRRIQRVECGVLHESFALKRNKIESDLREAFKPNEMVRLLFHGSHPDSLQKIIHAGEGFIPLYAGCNVGTVYGKGTYFASKARRAEQYCVERNGQGERQMIVAEVVVGQWTKGTKDLVHIPVVPGERYRTFNSMVDDVHSPTVFVIQNAQQAYPAYLISFV